MATRKRKVIIIVALALLGTGIAIFLLTRDSGPPVVVEGNLSAKDVAQIKSAVRRELWKEAFPNFSWATIKALPHSVKKALRSQVAEIRTENGLLNPVQYSDSNTMRYQAVAFLSHTGSSNSWDEFSFIYILTNGPGGWVCRRSFEAGWTSYSPLTH